MLAVGQPEGLESRTPLVPLSPLLAATLPTTGAQPDHCYRSTTCLALPSVNGAWQDLERCLSKYMHRDVICCEGSLSRSPFHSGVGTYDKM